MGLFLCLIPAVLFPAVHSVQARQMAMDAFILSVPDTASRQGVGVKPLKCGTFMYKILMDDWAALPADFKDKYASFFLGKSSSLQDAAFSYRIPGTGIPKYIYYDTMGTDAVPDSDIVHLTVTGFVSGADGIPDFVQFVAAALDSAYRFIVNTLGYSYSASQINIRMRSLGNIYGYAYSTDFMEVDNDLNFLGSMDRQDGYRVTVAHEFFHMVQFGYTAEFNFFNEPSAVWMEDKCYPDVNDYLQYLTSMRYGGAEKNIMDYPDYPLDAINDLPGNYDKVVWPMFLDQRYGALVIRYAWEQYQMGQDRTEAVFNTALSQTVPGLSFAGAFSEFSKWLYYTGSRADYRQTFIDAALWPAVWTDTLQRLDFIREETLSIRPLSISYQQINDRQGNEPVFRLLESDTLGIYLARMNTATHSLTQDTSILTHRPLVSLPTFAGVQSPLEIGVFSNPVPAVRRVGLTVSDSLYIFTPQTWPFIACDTLLFQSFRFLDSVVCFFKDTLGQPDTVGNHLFHLLANSGGTYLVRTTGDEEKKVSAIFNGDQIFRVFLHPDMDSLVAAGKVELRLGVIDSSRQYLIYQAAIVDTLSKAVHPLEVEGGYLAISYSTFRQGLPKVTGTDGLARPYCYLTIRTALPPALTGAFPNPVSADADKVHFLCAVPNGTEAECRLYTLSGKLVRHLRSTSSAEATRFSDKNEVLFSWDLRNQERRRIHPGVYFYYMNIGNGYSPVIGKVAVLAGKGH